MKQTIYRWAPTLYAFSMAILMLGYVRYGFIFLGSIACTADLTARFAFFTA